MFWTKQLFPLEVLHDLKVNIQAFAIKRPVKIPGGSDRLEMKTIYCNGHRAEFKKDGIRRSFIILNLH